LGHLDDFNEKSFRYCDKGEGNCSIGIKKTFVAHNDNFQIYFFVFTVVNNFSDWYIIYFSIIIIIRLVFVKKSAIYLMEIIGDY